MDSRNGILAEHKKGEANMIVNTNWLHLIDDKSHCQ